MRRPVLALSREAVRSDIDALVGRRFPASSGEKHVLAFASDMVLVGERSGVSIETMRAFFVFLAMPRESP